MKILPLALASLALLTLASRGQVLIDDAMERYPTATATSVVSNAASSNPASWQSVVFAGSGSVTATAGVGTANGKTGRAAIMSSNFSAAGTQYAGAILNSHAYTTAATTAYSLSNFRFSVDLRGSQAASVIVEFLSFSIGAGGFSQLTAVWSGSEMIVWGGYGGTDASPSFANLNNGHAYRPDTNEWRPLRRSRDAWRTSGSGQRLDRQADADFRRLPIRLFHQSGLVLPHPRPRRLLLHQELKIRSRYPVTPSAESQEMPCSDPSSSPADFRQHRRQRSWRTGIHLHPAGQRGVLPAGVALRGDPQPLHAPGEGSGHAAAFRSGGRIPWGRNYSSH